VCCFFLCIFCLVSCFERFRRHFVSALAFLVFQGLLTRASRPSHAILRQHFFQCQTSPLGGFKFHKGEGFVFGCNHRHPTSSSVPKKGPLQFCCAQLNLGIGLQFAKTSKKELSWMRQVEDLTRTIGCYRWNFFVCFSWRMNGRSISIRQDGCLPSPPNFVDGPILWMIIIISDRQIQYQLLLLFVVLVVIVVVERRWMRQLSHVLVVDDHVKSMLVDLYQQGTRILAEDDGEYRQGNPHGMPPCAVDFVIENQLPTSSRRLSRIEMKQNVGKVVVAAVGCCNRNVEAKAFGVVRSRKLDC